MFYNFLGFYIQNCCEKNPKNTRGRCRCSKLTSPTVCKAKFYLTIEHETTISGAITCMEVKILASDPAVRRNTVTALSWPV